MLWNYVSIHPWIWLALIGFIACAAAILLRRRPAGSSRPRTEVLAASERSRKPSRMPRAPVVAQRLELGPEGAPILTIERAGDLRGYQLQRCALPGPSLDRLSRLIAGSPTAMLAGVQVGANVGTYVLRFPPAVQAGLADGSLKLADAAGGGWRAFAHDGRSIVGHGTLTKAGPSATAVATAVWAVAAYVTAQKYLADIDRRLSAIEAGLDRLQMWSEHEVRAQLEGDMRYLRDLFESFRDGEVNEPDLQSAVAQFETVDRETSRRIIELQRRLEDLASEIEDRKIDIGYFSGGSLDEHCDWLCERAEEARRWLNDLVTALHVKGASAQLRSGLPLSLGFAQRRLRDLRDDIGSAVELHERLDESLHEQRHRLVGKWRGESSDRSSQQRVSAIWTQAAKHALAQIEGAREATKQVEATVAGRREAGQQPLQLVVEVRDGEVASCKQLVAAAPSRPPRGRQSRPRSRSR